MQPNKQYFLVRIDKKAQAEKRDKLLSQAAYLGMSVNELGPAIMFTKFTKRRGVRVENVAPDSPAYQAGFKRGDIIFKFDYKELKTVHDAMDFLSICKPGDEIEIEYLSQITQKYAKKKLILGRKTTTLFKSLVQEMENNLQYGQIVAIGENVHSELPEAQVGDTLIFHHNVEYKDRAPEDATFNDWHLQGIEENGDELRIVKDTELFGVIKFGPDGLFIFPHRHWIFCHYHIQPASFQMKDGLWLPEQWEMSMKEMQDKAELLEMEAHEIGTSTMLQMKTTEANYKRKEEIIKRLDEISREREALGDKMRQKRLIECKVLFFNEATTYYTGRKLVAGDTIACDLHALYPLEIGGVQYALANHAAVEYLAN